MEPVILVSQLAMTINLIQPGVNRRVRLHEGMAQIRLACEHLWQIVLLTIDKMEPIQQAAFLHGFYFKLLLKVLPRCPSLMDYDLEV